MEMRRQMLLVSNEASRKGGKQAWNDHRMSFEHILPEVTNSSDLPPYLTLTDPSKMWTPDTFFRNGLETKEFNVFETGNYVRIFPNGDVLYSIRYFHAKRHFMMTTFLT